MEKQGKQFYCFYQIAMLEIEQEYWLTMRIHHWKQRWRYHLKIHEPHSADSITPQKWGLTSNQWEQVMGKKGRQKREALIYTDPNWLRMRLLLSLVGRIDDINEGDLLSKEKEGDDNKWKNMKRNKRMHEPVSSHHSPGSLFILFRLFRLYYVFLSSPLTS